VTLRCWLAHCGYELARRTILVRDNRINVIHGWNQTPYDLMQKIKTKQRKLNISNVSISLTCPFKQIKQQWKIN